LAYKSFKELSSYKDFTRAASVSWDRKTEVEKKEKVEVQMRIILKWYSLPKNSSCIRMAIAIFFNFFWMVELILFLVPTAPIKLALGLWILLPQYSVRISPLSLSQGEFFLYNLISDKLETFEGTIRRSRNALAAKLASLAVLAYKYLIFSVTHHLSSEHVKVLKIKTEEIKDVIDVMHRILSCRKISK